ncbi:adenosylmethionine--8-amino-7-oxononanoate transaminase [Aneurinibacillus migulanus]|uniref:Adenosylmethionine-8-amino-7-oxononanoate aminotransferase n=1 Tax=Aneurinibacillus migulanus TaxID=47500 RepID=A0A0D1XHS7_ANEMI|nr:adenosylmethionine--8-amino-7-oxononanoate transaminase [Aneurinibacillus migulanus]KIV51813.1 adenosylmethionine-8-amino-7-oxononanoate aminotransferase [Aneurinibacillus migulanus]KON97933.1 adenosylmethionine-8-amino-7-oxononanoate aminotransferase [Aneurinibacillus migulanus]MED0891186.1 adenosylmethionine--8-amino-7-oxononanoate transaminase [Aneurinibacillus migulanus]MED1614126.1 adenosylmethionine--8-amino-7-oxononanoate transaminase [Aneurinibacillus migulanus]SDH98994.1 adenosylme
MTVSIYDLETWDKEYVWHPFTQMKVYRQEKPLIIERGEGSYLYDIEGKKYLDGYSSLWVNVHGHNHPELNAALTEQAGKIAHSTLLGSANVPSILLAKKLVDNTPPNLTKVFYSDSGSTSVEIALKMAYQYWKLKDPARFSGKKSKFISLREAYHGDTIGSVSVGGMDTFHHIFKPLLFDRLEAPAPYTYRLTENNDEEACKTMCLDALEAILKERHSEVAGLIIEPLVQGAAGMITAPVGFLRGVRELCTRYNVLMIADEVAVGFGRTGTLFACEQEQVEPDFLCIAKGLTAGYLPLAATLTTEEIFEAFLGEPEELRTFFHGHTYTGNQLACAVALKNIELIEREDLLATLPNKINFLAQKLIPFRELPHVGDVRQQGMMIGIELVQEKASKKTFPAQMQVEHQVILRARMGGAIIRPLGPVIVLMPILSMSTGELEQLIDITYEAIATVTVRAHALQR